MLESTSFIFTKKNHTIVASSHAHYNLICRRIQLKDFQSFPPLGYAFKHI